VLSQEPKFTSKFQYALQKNDEVEIQDEKKIQPKLIGKPRR
jgi:hypothetical protein